MRNKMDRQKILFSPLGGTDPISNFRDGSDVAHMPDLQTGYSDFIYVKRNVRLSCEG